MQRARKTIFRGFLLSLVLLLAAVPVLAQQAAPLGPPAESAGPAQVQITEPKGVPQSDRWESSVGPQTAGVPGSPSATTTIDGKQLPPPPPKFGGKIEHTTAGSKPWWPPRVVPPKGAPNVLLIMTDDVGFGATLSPRRWSVETPDIRQRGARLLGAGFLMGLAKS